MVIVVFRYPVRYDDSMNTVLAQELVRFNALVDTISSTLRDLLLALKGVVLMSADIDDVATSLRTRCCSNCALAAFVAGVVWF